MKLPKIIWKLMRFPPQLWYRLGLGPVLGRWILLLTTTGRRTGKARVTALQYQLIKGVYYIGSARQARADWVRNIMDNPYVKLRVKSAEFPGVAELISDPQRIADFLMAVLEKGPRMLKRLLRWEGLPEEPSRQDLVTFSQGMLIVGIRQEE